MPRDLAEVLHYFLPEAGGASGGVGVARSEPPAPLPAAEPRRRVVAIPFARQDLVRSALFWNLAVATARRAEGVRVVTTPDSGIPPLEAEPGRGPMGLEVLHARAAEPAALAACAEDAARGAGLVVAALPAEWATGAASLGPLLSRVVVLARPDSEEMVASYAALKRTARAEPTVELGACIFGVPGLAQASRAFDRLALAVARHLGRDLTSYGMLIDDVQLSRSIVNRRPIALAYPSAPSARALDDVAGLLLGDA